MLIDAISAANGTCMPINKGHWASPSLNLGEALLLALCVVAAVGAFDAMLRRTGRHR